jgi:16S rRNA (guanine527-N7)-methyltransferase
MIGLILKYFPGLSSHQKDQFERLKPVYEEWNSRINLISRKDIDNFYLHHILHSLAIARILTPLAGTSFLDVGTGGGFPGIPLAILFHDSKFTLLDSIRKKTDAVSDIITSLGLENTRALRARVEEHKETYDFVVSRAVCPLPEFVRITKGRISKGGMNKLANGILYLKGGDLAGEVSAYINRVTITDISDFFDEPFFETKKIVYLPA